LATFVIDVYEPKAFDSLFPDSTRSKLKQGDFKFQGAMGEIVLIERKSVNDLYSSLISGRINRQLVRCLYETPHTYLLIEGRLKELHGFVVDGLGHKSKFPFTALSNFLVSCQQQGVMLLLSTSIDSSSRVIKALHEYYQKDDHKSFESPAKRTPTNLPTSDPVMRQVDFLCGLPGIGPSAAKRLINEYKTPVAAIQALLAGKKVKGIGDSKLSSIITMLQGSDSK